MTYPLRTRFLSSFSSLESGIAARLTSIENLVRIALADLARISTQTDEHQERLYALEHEPSPSHKYPPA